MKIRDKFHFGNSSTNRLETVSVYLQLSAKKALRCSPVDFGVPWMGGKRTKEEQRSIYDQGHSNCDGTNKVSYHQRTNDVGLGLALDLVPYIPGEGFVYEATGRFGFIGALMLEAWEELQDQGEIPEGLYLHWGGLWNNQHGDPKRLGWDMAHFEIRTHEQVQRLT